MSLYPARDIVNTSYFFNSLIGQSR